MKKGLLLTSLVLFARACVLTGSFPELGYTKEAYIISLATLAVALGYPAY